MTPELLDTGWDLEAERDLWRDICAPRRHPEWYFWFVRVAMGIDFYCRANPDDRWFSPKLHRRFCAWLQHHHEEWFEWRRRGILRRKKIAAIMPRFTGKTQLCTKTSPLVIWLEMPNASGQIGSEDLSMAQNFYTPIGSILDGTAEYQWFSWLYGIWKDPDRPWDKKALVHAARTNTAITDPSLTIWSVIKGITSKHPDFGWLDDPLSEDRLKESDTHLSAVTAGVNRLRPAFRTNSFFGATFTRKRDADVAGVNIKGDGIRSWTGAPSPDPDFAVTPDGEWDVYFWQARDSETGESTLPMWTTAELNKYEETQPAEFASEMQNNPGQGDDAGLTREQIDRCWVDPPGTGELDPKHPVVFAIDTAFKTAERRNRGDESVITQWGLDFSGTGDVYFEGGFGDNKMDVDEFTTKLIEYVKAAIAAGRRVVAISDEKEMGGKEGTWEAYLRNRFRAAGLTMPRLITHPRQGTRKKTRVKETYGFWAEGHVKLIRGAAGAHKLIKQTVMIDYVKWDDWADCMADIFTREIYRPLLDKRNRTTDNAPRIIRPGDELLETGLSPSNADELRAMYDAAFAPHLRPDGGIGDPDVVYSNADWPFS